MNHYTQLTAFDRGRIEEMLQEHLLMHQIALKLHRSVSTISREVYRFIGVSPLIIKPRMLMQPIFVIGKIHIVSEN